MNLVGNLIDSQYKLHVSAYTSGMISATSSIRLRFANDMVALEQVGKNAPKDIVSFDPAIEGTFTWEDRQTLLFTPKTWLPAGQGSRDLFQRARDRGYSDRIF